MTDSVVTLRPNGTVAAGGWGVVGAASAHAALSDNSDSSYVTPGGGTLLLDFTASGIPADAVVHAVTIRVRMGTSGGNDSIRLAVHNAAGASNISHLASVSATNTTVTLAADTTAPGGVAWTTTIVDGLTVAVSGASVTNVYEVYVDVAYNQAPTATVTAPAGTVTNSTQPTVTWSYADPEGDLQERYRIKIFHTYTLAGFDPDVSTPDWDSGEVLGSGTSQMIGASLANNTTFRAYVKVADAGSGGRYGDWSYSTFVVQVDPPAVPTLTAVADPPNARVAVTAQSRDNILTANQASLETDTAGWQPQAGGNCTIARSTAQAVDGAASLALTPTVTGTMSAETLRGTSGTPVTPGTTYTAFASFRSAGSGRVVGVELAWYNSAGTFLSSVLGATTFDGSAASVQSPSVAAVAPVGAAYANVVTRVTSAAEVHYVDAAGIFVSTPTTWTRGGLFNNSLRLLMERSDDGGGTWQEVRGTDHAIGANGQYLIYDDEAPPLVTVYYRVHAVGYDSGYVSSDYATPIAVTLSLTDSWLKDPLDPTVNTTIDLQLPVRTKQRERQTIFESVGRRRPVVLRDTLLGEEGTLVIDCYGNAERDAVDAVRANQRTVLVQTPLGDNWYASLGDSRDSDLREGQSVTDNYRQITIPFLEVDAP